MATFRAPALPMLLSALKQKSACQQRQLSHGRHLLAPEHARYFPAKTTPMLPPGTFSGKLAFITGGATGLGKGLALNLSQLGATVIIASRSADRLKKTATEISETTGNKVADYRLDVRDPAAIKSVFDDIESTHGLPDIVVNNAAGNFISPSERLSPNAFATVVNIVLNGTAYITLDVGKRLIKAKKGARFLAVSADYADSGSGFVIHSAAAKAGVEAITRSLASEWARYGMTFNAISPGPVETKGAFSRLDPTGQFMDKFIEKIPTGRIGEVGEFTNLATYLVSDYANWINGQVIRLNGGEYPCTAGLFNDLKMVSKEQWDQLEAMIKNVKGS
ncbi:2,4-dienoyl-coa reductase, mitochondrial [Plakobranchus ocellatus]|uniref:2,4-dienoyl-coa reductase, mitochondrial n=1 Tax=Plakobranchus ocellatus TaxID=259542 RepID=A0AAV3XVI4_9GAST|nr:2,4-dienoyl-coa reductase, mitochondrial [Plakobranchus ocellatus]